MRKINAFIIVLLFCSCYRAKNLPVDKTPPTFEFTVNHSNPADTIMTFEVIKGDPVRLDFSFTMLSGNPENYPVTVYFDSLPAKTTTSQDSVIFKLDYNFIVHLYVNADTCYHTFNIKVLSAAYGLQTYPVRLHVLPTPPPYDCANCLARYWRSVSDCSSDSCKPVVSAIAGMPNWVSIRNISCLGDSIVVNALVSCKDGITIPVQSTNGYTIYGRFNYTIPCGDVVAFTISDTIIHNGDTQACQFLLKSW